MYAVLEWLAINHSLVTAAATVVIATTAGITVWLTRSLVRENQLLRKVGKEPKVIAYLEGDPRQATLINLVLANVGRGPACNIEFEFDFEERFYANGRVAPLNRSDRQPYGFLPQDNKICMFFGSGHGLLNEDGLPPFRAKVRWENLNGREYVEEYPMDVRQFLGIFPPSAAADHDIAESLKKIARRLDRFASSGSSGRLKVETMTAADAHQARHANLEQATEEDKDRRTPVDKDL